MKPPPPNAKLTTDQINLIAKWINQGAKNEICNPNYGQPVACADHGVTYSGFVQKIVNNQCVACHKASNPSGGVRLDSYDAVLTSVQNGGFLGSIEGKPTFTKMPYNANSLDTCTVNKIKNWISNGEDFQIIDVRETSEYEQINIGAHLIPLGEVIARNHEIEREKKVVIHCRSGARSAKAIRQLEEIGFDNLYNLKGGILAIEQETLLPLAVQS